MLHATPQGKIMKAAIRSIPNLFYITIAALLIIAVGHAVADDLNATEQQSADSIIALVNMFGAWIVTQSWYPTVANIITKTLIVIGGSAVFVKLLEKIASITPSTKDDLAVGYLKRFLGFLSYILTHITLPVKKEDKPKSQTENK